MRIGLMIGPEHGWSHDKLARFLAETEAAERAGFRSLWVPQVPGEFDALTAIALMGRVTQRIELGTAVVPIQTRHPLAMSQQVLSTQAACAGRLTLGLGASHHWIVGDMLGLPYAKPVEQVRRYLDVLDAAFAGTGRVDVENDAHRVHSPLGTSGDGPPPVLLAALAPRMLRLAGERASGTILWMADERAIGEHVAPRITAAATAAGRPAPRIVAGVPVAVCPDDEVRAARARANQVLGHAEYSPNYQQLLERGDARDVGDILAAGDESAVVARLRSFRDAGATDLAVRVLPLGSDRASRLASKQRTLELIAALGGDL